jgi:hypothetical protein
MASELTPLVAAQLSQATYTPLSTLLSADYDAATDPNAPPSWFA